VPAVSDDVLRAIAQGVLDANPTIVQQYKNGKTTTIGFFV
jgi:Asp-tRNA(Asn)/Glu-tRNA(Gln) amidotransferase B subunit